MNALRLLFPFALALMLTACAGDGALKDKMAATSPADDGTLRLAEATRQGGDFKAAVNLYQQILKRNPANEAARLGLAETQLAAGETERARLTYADAAQRNPKSAEPPLGLARIAVMKRNFAEAEAQYTKAQSLAPAADIRALYGLGVVRDLQARHPEAQELYQQALATQPENSAVRSNLGLSLALGGNPRHAINVLLEIATAPSAPPQARQNLALAYGLLGNMEAAETVLSADLQRPVIQNNLHYYDYLRGQEFRRPAVTRDAMP